MAANEEEVFPVGDGMCHEGGVTPVKARTIHELHSLQKKKKSAPTTPTSSSAGPFLPTISEDELHWLQLQSISTSLASLTRELGPKLVKGDPARKAESAAPLQQYHQYMSPTDIPTDTSLKLTHVLYLS